MKKILVGLAALVLVGLVTLVIVLSLSLGSIVKKGVETVGPQITKTEVKLDGATLSIFSGAGSLKGFVLGNPDGYSTPQACKVGQVGVGVEPRSVLSDKIHVTHVRVEGAEITFEGTLGTKNNLTRILENVESTTGGNSPAGDKPKGAPIPQPAGPGPGKKLQVDDFLIRGAKVNVSMTALGGKELTVSIPDIHLANLGTGPEGITAGELTKKILSEVNPAVLKAVEKSVADLGQAATDTLKSLSSPDVDKAAKSLGGLLKKK